MKKKPNSLYKKIGMVGGKASQVMATNNYAGSNETSVVTVHRLRVPADASRIIRRHSSSSSFSSRSASPIRPLSGDRLKEREKEEQNHLNEVLKQNDAKISEEESLGSKGESKSRSRNKLVKTQLWRELRFLVEEAEKFKESVPDKGCIKGKPVKPSRSTRKLCIKTDGRQGKMPGKNNSKSKALQQNGVHITSCKPLVQKKLQAAIKMQLKLEKSQKAKNTGSGGKVLRKSDGPGKPQRWNSNLSAVAEKKGMQGTKYTASIRGKQTFLGLSRQETKKLLESPSRYSLHPDYELTGKSTKCIHSEESNTSSPKMNQNSRSSSPVRTLLKRDALRTCPPAPMSPSADSYGSLVRTLENESQKVNKKLQLDEASRHSQRSSVRQSEGSFHYKEISLRKYENFVQIIFTPGSTKMKNSFNLQVLKELQEALMMLKKDESCKVVLLTSAGSTFCQGIDLNGLLHSNMEKRKKIAEGLEKVLKKFLQTLGHFSKPLVAGVNGAAIGLGVTILPFFDMVFASDKATFYLPYSKLGQVPEGGATLTFPHLLQSSMMNDLLYGCKKLTAGEAFQCGLVTSVLWPAKFQEELIPRVRNIAAQSSQAMEATKALLRHHLRTKLEVTLDSECRLLVQHWSSSECQRNMKKFLETEDVALQRQRFETQ